MHFVFFYFFFSLTFYNIKMHKIFSKLHVHFIVVFLNSVLFLLFSVDYDCVSMRSCTHIQWLNGFFEMHNIAWIIEIMWCRSETNTNSIWFQHQQLNTPKRKKMSDYFSLWLNSFLISFLLLNAFLCVFANS